MRGDAARTANLAVAGEVGIGHWARRGDKKTEKHFDVFTNEQLGLSLLFPSIQNSAHLPSQTVGILVIGEGTKQGGSHFSSLSLLSRPFFHAQSDCRLRVKMINGI